MLFIANSNNFFLAEFVGGSLAKRCRNQEGKLAFLGFHGKIPHFSVKIPRGVPYRIVVRNEEKTLGFCVFFIANSNIFWAELVRGSLAKCCCNQKGTLEFSMLFIETAFLKKIPRG